MKLEDQIRTATRGTFLIGGLILAVIYYFLIFDEGRLFIGSIEGLKSTRAIAQKEIEKARQVAAAKDKFEKELDLVSRKLNAALELLPTKMKEEEVMDKISSEAAAAGLNLKRSDFKPSEQKTFYDELHVEVEMEGNYLQILKFFSLITSRNIKRIISLRNLELTKTGNVEGRALLNMRGTLISYRYVEGRGEAKDKAGAPAGNKPPGQAGGP